MEIFRQSDVASYAVVPLIDRANRPDYKASPTLAAGDVKIIRHTGGVWNYANPGTLPAIIGGSATKQVLITLTATELTSDNLDYPIIVQFVDQTATKEWDDQTVIIWTKPIAANATQILGTAISAPATAGILDVNVKNIANAAINTSSAQIGINIVNAAGTAWNSGGITANTFAADAITAAKIAADVGVEIAAAVWNALTSGMTAVGSIGKKMADWVVGTITANQAVNVAQWGGSNIVTPDVTGAPVVTVSGTKKTLDGLNDLSAASVNTEVDTALTDIKLDHLVAVAESGDVVNSSIIAKLASKSATPAFTSFDNTTDSLEAIADGESLTTVDVTKINGSTEAARLLALSAGGMVSGAVDTTALSPTTTIFETDITEATTNQYKDRWILFTSGVNTGSAKPIVAYSLTGGRGRFTTYAFPSAPGDEDEFIVV